MVLFVVPVLVSCASDYDTVVQDTSEENGLTSLCLTISTGGDAVSDDNEASVFAGTPADGEYMPGEGFENYIQFVGEQRDFRVYLVNETDDKVLRVLDNPMVRPLGANGKQYRLDMLVTSDEVRNYLSDGSIKIMMLANWRRYPENVVGRTVSDIVKDPASVFSYTPFGGRLTVENRIPMFGIRRFDNVKVEEGGVQELGMLNMLRAFAKIEIVDKNIDNADAPKIEKAELVRYTNSAAMAPYGVTDQNGYVFGTWTLDYGGLSVPEGATVNESAASLVRLSEEPSSYIIYCPEYKNTGEGVTPSGIRVTYSDGVTYMVEFKNYGTLPGMAKDEIFDIKRNNWYSFALKREQGMLDIEVDVQPYASCSMNAPLGVQLDEMGDMIVHKEEDPKNPGQLKLPDAFKEYLSTHNKTLPAFEYHDELGDYYVIHLGVDGTMAGSEVWLKDNAGCRVMSDFNGKDDTPNCSTRRVLQYSGTDTYEYYKDRNGESRLQHNEDHSSVVYDNEGVMIFKNADNTERYRVESWDSATGKFFILSESPTKYVFHEYDKTGKPTGKVVEMDR